MCAIQYCTVYARCATQRLSYNYRTTKDAETQSLSLSRQERESADTGNYYSHGHIHGVRRDRLGIRLSLVESTRKYSKVLEPRKFLRARGPSGYSGPGCPYLYLGTRRTLPLAPGFFSI